MSKIADFVRQLQSNFPYSTHLRIQVEFNSFEAATVLAAIELIKTCYETEKNDPILKAVHAKVINAMHEEADYIGRNINASVIAKLKSLDPEWNPPNVERPSEERQDETDSGTE